MRTKPITVGVVMDSLKSIRPKNDSTVGLLLSAQSRGCAPFYLTLKDLYVEAGHAWGSLRPLMVKDREQDWYTLGSRIEQPLDQLDIILMRKDPPVDETYIYATQILAMAEKQGVLVVNRPKALLNHNEKILALQFPSCMAPTLVTANREKIKQFIDEHKAVVIKPLGIMGGRDVFQLHKGDPNINSLVNNLTEEGKKMVMVQLFMPAIYSTGDKRILLIDGKPLHYVLTRKPAEGDFRANMVAGGLGEGGVLNERDEWICAQIGPALRKKGIFFAGIDVIGDFLTEINITSPTGIRVLEHIFSADISGKIWDNIFEKLGKI